MSAAFSRLIFLSLSLISAPILAAAQPVKALAEAKARLICGTGTPVAAQYLPRGLLQVTCRQDVPNSASNSVPKELQGTGLSSTAAAGAVAAAVITIILVGSGGSSTTTTSGE